MKACLIVLLFLAVTLPSMASEDYWVTTDRLNRRTCPSTKCGIVGQLFFREKVTVSETKEGFGRVSKPYDAYCLSGRSKYVDKGKASCTPDNGIVDGKFSEWAWMASLSKSRPADPGVNATGIASLVSASDDYLIHKGAFIKAAQALLDQRKCTESDFKEYGGWMKSTKYRDQPIYFMYCGGYRKSNKIHLDASSGRIFR